MKKSVLAQAKARLQLAERAYASLCACEGHEEAFQMHWLDFLVQWKGSYTKIQQAAKDTPKEVQWFGSVNAERRKDPLLRYLFEARNDGEHGTKESAFHKGKSIAFTSYGKQIGIKFNSDGSLFLGPDGKPVILDDGKPIEQVKTAPAVSKLFPVTERDGNKTVPPPTSHLGSPMEPVPYDAARLGLEWLKLLVATAMAMSEP